MSQPSSHNSKRRWAIAAATLLFGGAAFALPWDIDMVDQQFARAYEWAMFSPPEGTISRDRYVANYDRNTPEGQRLRNPYTVDAPLRGAGGVTNSEFVALGQQRFEIYCEACHGENGEGGAPVADHKPAEDRVRYKIPPARLSGGTTNVPTKSDGYIYLTIRNGGAIMPGYGSALDDDEMWAIVAFLRTLDGNTYTGPFK